MTPTPEILPGAEPWSSAGGPSAALVLHGFTGNPHSMRGVAQAMADAGFTVELPLLPGHGTTVEDMMETTFDDWSAAARSAYQELAARSDQVVVVGLSMGGALAAWLAIHEQDIAGIVCINASVSVPEPLRAMAQELLDAGEVVAPGIGSDIADPDATELAYPETPLAPLLSLMAAADEFGGQLDRVTCPTLVITSSNDHVVPPENSDQLAAAVSGPVERVTLERSYHVATLDYDKDEVIERTVDFARKVTSG